MARSAAGRTRTSPATRPSTRSAPTTMTAARSVLMRSVAALLEQRGEAAEVDGDEDALGLGRQQVADVARAPGEDLAPLDPVHTADERQLAVQRCRVAVADGERAGHARAAGEGLRHPQDLVE